jgi:two-component system, OmpR family, alkaline phosphatase synthesis response regulator PhoP
MSKRILIVDDEPNIARIIEMNLTREGYEVTKAADGIDGLEAARRERPDLILLDVHMPLMNGLEMLAQMKADPDLASLPVIMLTAQSGRDELARGLDAGAEYYVTKPIDPQQLMEMIGRFFADRGAAGGGS